MFFEKKNQNNKFAIRTQTEQQTAAKEKQQHCNNNCSINNFNGSGRQAALSATSINNIINCNCKSSGGCVFYKRIVLSELNGMAAASFYNFSYFSMPQNF